MAFEKFKEDWEDMDPKWRTVILAIVAAGVVVVGYKATRNDHRDNSSPPLVDTSTSAPAPGTDGTKNDPAFHLNVLPTSNRNQGLEDLQTQIQSLSEEVTRLKSGADVTHTVSAPVGSANEGNDTSASIVTHRKAATEETPPVDLNQALPPPSVSFEQPGFADKTRPARQAADATDPVSAQTPATPKMKVWAAEPASVNASAAKTAPGPAIPVNSALEAVMLSGVNARPSGAIGGAVGSVNTANNVGAPFVTRIKGDAILPNGWKIGDLGDCFLSGSAVAILSTERAYAVAENLSCIDKNGEIFEAPVKAYALDVDGTLGIAGKVVSKQGSLLLQTALTGMASGLGAALTPSTLPSYNSNATSGSTTGIQYPNAGLVAYTAVGQGINQAAAQLSRFYLEYAREIFPVVEVVSGTRVTWVFKETVELKKRSHPGSSS